MRLFILLRVHVPCLLIWASIGTAAAASTIRADHPFLGRWTWDFRGCTEIYDNRADGTAVSNSGEEVGQSTYTISDEPEDSGFYRLVDTVTRSNGKTGCDGTPGGTPVGDEATRFIFIRPSGDEMLVCRMESVESCHGPLKRIGR
jgi:hypothetical protein